MIRKTIDFPDDLVEQVMELKKSLEQKRGGPISFQSLIRELVTVALDAISRS